MYAIRPRAPRDPSRSLAVRMLASAGSAPLRYAEIRTRSMARDAMRVLHRDPKTGEIKVRVENADDLWHLHNLVLPGDLVRASTYRREEVKTDKVRPERGEKVRVTLTTGWRASSSKRSR